MNANDAWAGALVLRHDIEEPGQVFVGIPAKKLR